MPISRNLLAGSLAGAALLLGAGAALADPAQATGAVNVRSGPGVGYSIVDQLYPGENVDVGRCDGGWCFVDHSGPDGWVSANYLSPSGDYGPPPPPPPVYYDEEPEYVPAPVFINPPVYYNRRDFHRHFPHRHYPGTPRPPVTSPPPVTTPPPPVQHHFPPGYGRQFQSQSGTVKPPVQHQQFPPGYGRQFRSAPSGQGSGGSNICATDPTAPICSSGSGPHHH
jgi:uncharacterized protein YraI